MPGKPVILKPAPQARGFSRRFERTDRIDRSFPTDAGQSPSS
jgi:hypothetical protein